MARDVKWDDGPISDEDRVWVEQRLDSPAGGNMTYREKLEAHDAEHGRAEKLASKSRDERRAELRSLIADAQNELERLDAEEAREGNPNVAVTGDPAVGLIRDNTGVDGQPPEGAAGTVEDYSNEKTWTRDALRNEIDGRNEERKADNLPPISKTGTRAELVDRLKADDEEIAKASES